MTSSTVHCHALAIYGFKSIRVRQVEEAGHAYESDLVRHFLALGQDPSPVVKIRPPSRESTESPDSNDENVPIADVMDKDDEKYTKFVGKLDPNNWKEQDHYRVLGLNKLRHSATMGQIKSAYRQKVLMYHPDKGKASKNGLRNESIFACIQKAFEQLGVEESLRRAYDSVDPKFNDAIPEEKEIKSHNFFDILGPFFERHSRFSVEQPVPLLGEMSDDRDVVEGFYHFWLHFNSWREYSYKDSEDKSKGEDRWERREIEKQNRVEREKLRKEYVKSLSSMVEVAYSKDPRIKLFKEQDKKAKEDQKALKRAEKERIENERKAAEQAEADKIEKERLEKVEQEKKEAAARQKAKKALQAERKKIRDFCKSKDFFTEDPTLKLKIMEHMERVCLTYTLEELSLFVERLKPSDTYEEALNVFEGNNNEVKKPEKKEEKKPAPAPAPPSNVPAKWSHEEVQLLIKACNLYPAGSVERWVQVTKYVNDHYTGTNKPRKEKEVIQQAKIMKSLEASAAFANVEPAPSTVPGLKAAPTLPTPTEAPKQPTTEEDKWSSEQQKQLEVALKAVDTKDAQRWEKIAEQVEGKSKKQCMQRYKKLVQMIKDAKQQQ